MCGQNEKKKQTIRIVSRMFTFLPFIICATGKKTACNSVGSFSTARVFINIFERIQILEDVKSQSSRLRKNFSVSVRLLFPSSDVWYFSHFKCQLFEKKFQMDVDLERGKCTSFINISINRE